MRAAPPVAFEARSFGAWRAGITLVALLSAAAIGAWMAQGGMPAVGALLIAVVAGCAVSLWRQPPFALEWDGTCWSLREGGVAAEGQFGVMIDLGPWMLLRWRADGQVASRWLPVQAGDAPSHWRAFRAAVYCRPFADAVRPASRGSDG